MARPFPAAEFLLCPPAYYAISYEINPWMSLKHPANHARAIKQWQNLCAVLRRLGAKIRLLSPQPGVPDLVFTANAGLVVGRAFIRSNFRYPQRRREEPCAERYFRKAGFRIIRLPSQVHFEGEGDALWMKDTLVMGFKFRSEAPAHEVLTKALQARVLPVELADKRFYHLDTCFCPLDEKQALWFPKAFDRYGRKALREAAETLISVSEPDALRFACNTIVIGKTLVMPAGVSKALLEALKRRGFKIVTVELSEFLKAGGSAKCLVLRLDRKQPKA